MWWYQCQSDKGVYIYIQLFPSYLRFLLLSYPDILGPAYYLHSIYKTCPVSSRVRPQPFLFKPLTTTYCSVIMPFILPSRTPDHFKPARSLTGEESYAAQRFLGHITHCVRCAYPLKTLSSGSRLCSRGAAHAQNIALYMESKGGVVYSNADRETPQMALKFTEETEVIRELFIALERYPQANAARPTAKRTRRASVVLHNRREEEGLSQTQLLSPPASPSLSSDLSPELSRRSTIHVAQSAPKANRSVYRGLYSYYSVSPEPSSRADRREERTYHSTSRSRSPPMYHR